MEEQMKIPETLSGCIEQAIAQGWVTWKTMHAKGVSGELAWSERVLNARVEIDILKAGRLRIQVKINAQKRWEAETFFFQYQAAGEGLYQLVAEA